MARYKSRKKRGTEEMPQLKSWGLTFADTTGHGNCLFHALSDQMYGDQSHHAQLRAETVQYMREHPEGFRSFVIANPGGGLRRNPKRKNPGALRDTFDPTPPSEADIDTAYALSLDLMAKGGTYGDNAEIIAFSNRFQVDIRIYSAGMECFLDAFGDTDSEEELPTLFIVHHTYEHFSSIRNIDGPATGLPLIDTSKIPPEHQKPPRRNRATNPPIETWMIDIAMGSLPYDANRSIVEQTLKQCRGNINLAVDILLPDSSPETSERSSSIEREPDSDDEKEQKPTKKQDRRQSRPHPLSNNLAVRSKDGGLASPNPHDLTRALNKVDDTNDEIDPDETEEEDWKEEGPYHDSESASVSTSASDYSNPDHSQQSKTGVTRFRLSQPKKPESPTPLGSAGDKPEIEYQLKSIKPQRVIAKPRRRRLVSGNDRAADLAKKSARNQHLANHATANSQQEQAPVQGIKAIKI